LFHYGEGQSYGVILIEDFVIHTFRWSKLGTTGLLLDSFICAKNLSIVSRLADPSIIVSFDTNKLMANKGAVLCLHNQLHTIVTLLDASFTIF